MIKFQTLACNTYIPQDTWLTTLCTRVTSSLRDVGKGWFNIEENKWEVYEISKLRKFMELVKFAMQDSLR